MLPPALLELREQMYQAQGDFNRALAVYQAGGPDGSSLDVLGVVTPFRQFCTLSLSQKRSFLRQIFVWE